MEEEEVQSQENCFLDEETKWAIIISIEYFHLKYDDIIAKFQIKSKRTISKIYQKYLLQNNVKNNYNFKGRTQMIDNQIEECLSQILEDFQGIPSTTFEIKNHLDQDHNVNISQIQIHNCLKKLGLKYGKIKYIHQLTEDNKLARIQHAQALNKLDFDRIVFSDESIFQLNENGLQIWYKNDSELSREKKEFNNQYRQAMVWGSISTQGKFELYIHTTSVDSNAYLSCVEKSLLPFTKNLYGRKKWQLLQDGARSHSSKATLNWCQDNKINVFQNSAWSPGLNPIKLVWANMKKFFKKRQSIKKINNKEQLINEIIEIWNEQAQEFINNCIMNVENLIPEIIQQNGAYLQ